MGQQLDERSREATSDHVRDACFETPGSDPTMGCGTQADALLDWEPEEIHGKHLESVRRLTAGIAHEINTPTQYIGDNSQFLLDAFHEIRAVLARYDELLRAASDETRSDALIAAAEKAVADVDMEYLLEEIPHAINQTLEGVDRIAAIVRDMKDFSHRAVAPVVLEANATAVRKPVI